MRFRDSRAQRDLRVQPYNARLALHFDIEVDHVGTMAGATLQGAEAEKFLAAMAAVAEAWGLGRWSER